MDVFDMASKGLRVFPLRDGSKFPAVSGWPSVATTDKDQIREWSKTFTNFGVVGDGLVVLDVDNDSHGGKDGPGELRKYEEKYGTLPDTLTVTTASGGKHYYFRPEEGKTYTKGADKLGTGLDIQTRSAYLVAPGSKIPGSRLGTYTGEDHEIAQLPKWIADILEKSSRPSRATVKGGKPISDAYVRGVVRRYLKRLDECSEFGWSGPPWDQTCFVVAASLIEIANNPHNGYELDTALSDFLNHAPTDEGFGYDDHMQKWESALRKVDGRQRTLDKADQELTEPPSYKDRWERVKSSESKMVRPKALQEALSVYATRVLGDEWGSVDLYRLVYDKCLEVLHKVSDEESAKTWLTASKKVIDKAKVKHEGS